MPITVYPDIVMIISKNFAEVNVHGLKFQLISYTMHILTDTPGTLSAKTHA